MENIAAKAQFLKSEYTKLLATLDLNAERKWGKMNVPQMIEHMNEYVRIGYGAELRPATTPEEHLPKYREFLMSERPFRENTPNALLGDAAPPAAKHTSKEAAIAELKGSIDSFFEAFKNEPGKMIKTPFFGELDEDMSVQLLHKHALHHLRQFGMDI